MTLSIGVAVIVMIFLEPILKFLGAIDAVLPYALEYARVFWPCFPVVCVGMQAYFFCRLAERPKAAAVAFVFAGALAIVAELSDEGSHFRSANAVHRHNVFGAGWRLAGLAGTSITQKPAAGKSSPSSRQGRIRQAL